MAIDQGAAPANQVPQPTPHRARAGRHDMTLQDLPLASARRPV
jgi:hypothetical protein